MSAESGLCWSCGSAPAEAASLPEEAICAECLEDRASFRPADDEDDFYLWPLPAVVIDALEKIDVDDAGKKVAVSIARDYFAASPDGRQDIEKMLRSNMGPISKAALGYDVPPLTPLNEVDLSDCEVITFDTGAEDKGYESAVIDAGNVAGTLEDYSLQSSTDPAEWGRSWQPGDDDGECLA